MTAIARTWRGRVPADRSDDYLSYLRRTGVPDLAATPGNRSVQVLRRTVGEVSEFTIISTWDTEDAIRAFAGDPVDAARYYPEDADFLLELPECCEHWQLADSR
ncbi:MAG TPA: antibiotic biosynthesis monooxygenase [Candidatus Limnocylindrales bacterium]|nr:antibiotic biosynthesis monooxygenase [Candidatus Limnocylindrales bacterium]